jgi:hypothetical protein
VPRLQLESKAPHNHGKYKRRLLKGEGGADAFARSGAKRKIGKSIDRRSRIAEKAPRIERIGPIPQQAMPVQHIGRDHDQRSRFDTLPVQLIAIKRDAADRGYRRIEADGFLDNRAGLDQTIRNPAG